MQWIASLFDLGAFDLNRLYQSWSHYRNLYACKYLPALSEIITKAHVAGFLTPRSMGLAHVFEWTDKLRKEVKFSFKFQVHGV